MGKISEFLTEGTVTLRTVSSPINGELAVKWDAFFGYQIMGGGLWQVGGPVESVWKAALSKITNDKLLITNVLILGLGGGSAAKIIRKKWLEAKITGVDIDPVIVQLGKDYIGLNKLDVDIKIADAQDYVKSQKLNVKWDLICVDLYVGDNFPEKFDSDEFVKLLKNHLSEGGYVLVNRLYEGKRTALAEKFRKKLAKKFTKIEDLHLINETNVVYVCS